MDIGYLLAQGHGQWIKKDGLEPWW
jgi:hypothetical protein